LSAFNLKRDFIALFATVMIPLGNSGGGAWQNLEFRKIPKNTVSFTDNSINVKVKNSASPLVYPLPRSAAVHGFHVKLAVHGRIRWPEGVDAPWEEDSIFRLGFVVKGQRRLNRLQRLAAPEWVRKLYALAPPKGGIDRIVFFNVVDNPKLVGKVRVHPKSDLLEERAIAARKPDQTGIEINYDLEKPLDVAAVWISIDGDDTHSQFDIEIREITLNVQGG
jgi:hypothetical protein